MKLQDPLHQRFEGALSLGSSRQPLCHLGPYHFPWSELVPLASVFNQSLCDFALGFRTVLNKSGCLVSLFASLLLVPFLISVKNVKLGTIILTFYQKKKKSWSDWLLERCSSDIDHGMWRLLFLLFLQVHFLTGFENFTGQ